MARLPLGTRRAIAGLLGQILFLLARRRRRVAERNLALCLPHLPASRRRAVARAHFAEYAVAFFDLFEVCSDDERGLRERVHLEGIERLEALGSAPVIVLGPHFLGLDAVGIRLSLERPVVSMYAAHPSPELNALLLRGRSMHSTTVMVSREEGIGRLVRLLKRGHVAYFLPDMDLGARDSVFVPFFGQQAATVTSVVRIARMTGAHVLPLVARRTPTGYAGRFYEPWQHREGEDLVQAVRRMNQFIEDRVRENPSEYLWTHRRFKTRPPGEPSPYHDAV